MTPSEVVQAALLAAQSEPRHEQSHQALHRARSKALVEAIGEELRRTYATEYHRDRRLGEVPETHS